VQNANLPGEGEHRNSQKQDYDPGQYRGDEQGKNHQLPPRGRQRRRGKRTDGVEKLNNHKNGQSTSKCYRHICKCLCGGWKKSRKQYGGQSDIAPD